MLFVDENNVIDFKQALYFFIAQDCKTINNILNSLMR